MADITLKLIWYRMHESYSKMADTASWFSWEENFLDVLLFGWIGWAALVVFVVNAVLTFFGPLQPRISWDKSRDGTTSTVAVVKGPHGEESCHWLNSAFNWLYLHYNNFPEFVDAWVKSLNDQAGKLGGPVQLKFERVQSGSLPPKFSDVLSEASPDDKYVVHCRVDSRDISFAVFASQQTHEGVKLTNLTVSILKLRGLLKIECYKKGETMMANVSFVGRPDVKVVGKPVNPYQDPADLVDIEATEDVVRNTICLASTTFNLSDWILGEGQNAGHGGIPIMRTLSDRSRTSDNVQISHSPQSPRKTQQVFEPIEVKEQHQSAFHSPKMQSPPVMQSQVRYQKAPDDVEKRLLIKVIKASGLGQKELGTVDPFCVVYVDTPPQSDHTSVVRNTLNPFWDEQFFFELNPNSQEVRCEVLDKRRPTGQNFLGEAIIYCEDLRRTPSSRQIIPLQGRLGAGDIVSGSITLEFLCMEPSEMDAYDDSNFANSQISPRRTIETSKTVTPGGTLVTTTTTTTERPQNSRFDANVDASPSYIEKRQFDFNGDVEQPPSQSSTGSYDRRIPTIESSPTEESRTTTVSTSPESQGASPTHKEKKKSSSFAKQIKKRFSRSKKRSLSADRVSGSLREGSNRLRPPDQAYGPQSKDDLELVRREQETPNLKKSRSLGGSLKKLFRRSRRRSRSQGRDEASRESSVSRQSRQNPSQGPSREGSLGRSSNPHETVVL